VSTEEDTNGAGCVKFGMLLDRKHIYKFHVVYFCKSADTR